MTGDDAGRYVLRDESGGRIPGESYDDHEKALGARERLMADLPEGVAVTIDDTADDGERPDPFDGHRVMDVEVTSNAADGAVIDVNGTQLFITQQNRHVPLLAEIYVQNESEPLGAINTARRETVCLGGVEEALADRVDEIREMPIEEMPAALEELAYRLNPAGREKPADSSESSDADAGAGE